MKIIDTFLELTSQTYPHGHERELERFLPKGICIDEFGNYFMYVGDKTTTTMFTCHLDTASYEKSRVTHVISDDKIFTDGRTILGADDKSGMTILLWMIHKGVQGLYYFFLGEERGCIGSGKLKRVFTQMYPLITKIVSFDRRGTHSVITHQSYGRTASDEFARDLSRRLNETGYGFRYEPDPTGIYTDSNQFASIVPECTNISVGYRDEHSTYESQIISHLENLCYAVTQIDWESVVVARDPKVKDSGWGYDYGYWGRSQSYTERDEWFDDYFSQSDSSTYSHGKTYYDGITIDEFGDLVDSNDEISLEDIKMVLDKMEVEYQKIHWDGEECYVEIDGSMQYFADRENLVDFIDYYQHFSNQE